MDCFSLPNTIRWWVDEDTRVATALPAHHGFTCIAAHRHTYAYTPDLTRRMYTHAPLVGVRGKEEWVCSRTYTAAHPAGTCLWEPWPACPLPFAPKTSLPVGQTQPLDCSVTVSLQMVVVGYRPSATQLRALRAETLPYWPACRVRGARAAVQRQWLAVCVHACGVLCASLIGWGQEGAQQHGKCRVIPMCRTNHLAAWLRVRARPGDADGPCGPFK